MANQQLVDYVKQTMAQGYTAEQIRSHLVGHGYQASDVGDAISEAQQVNQGTSFQSAPSQQLQSSKSTPPKGGIKHREPWKVLLFSFLTLGIYAIYWQVATTKELKNNTVSAPNPWLLLLFLVPFVNIFFLFYYFWKYSCAIHELTGYEVWTLFLLWIFISPVAAWIAQKELNTRADH